MATENKRNLIDELSILTIQNEIFHKNNKELVEENQELTEEVEELRTSLNKMQERIDIDCGRAAYFIHQYLVRYGRISVTQSKEKFGTVRVYCSLGYWGFFSLLNPGHVYVHWPKWLYGLDLKYGRPVMQLFNKIVVPYHKFIYRRAYKKAVEKYPFVEERILRTADFPDLLEKL
jgi:hypothetical protein